MTSETVALAGVALAIAWLLVTACLAILEAWRESSAAIGRSRGRLRLVGDLGGEPATSLTWNGASDRWRTEWSDSEINHANFGRATAYSMRILDRIAKGAPPPRRIVVVTDAGERAFWPARRALHEMGREFDGVFR